MDDPCARPFAPPAGPRPHRLPIRAALLAGLVLLALLPAPLTAQAPDLFRMNLDSRQGLCSDSVMAIAQDHDGYMWIGTGDGLDRWDGRVLVHFRHDPNDPNSLSCNDVRALLADRAGRLWVGTGSGGVSLLEADRATWRRFRHDPADPRSLGSDEALALLQDQAGAIWVGAWGGGLNRFEPGSGRFTRFRHDPGNRNSLCSDDVAALAEDGSRRLWIGTGGGGLSRLDPGRNRWTTFRHDGPDPDGPGNDSVTELLVDRDGGLWVGTWGAGIDRLDLRHERWSHFRPVSPGGNGPVGGVVFSIHQDVQGTIWVATDACGLNRYHPGGNRWSFSPAPSQRAFRYVECVTSDRGGVLWIGAMPGGAYRYPLARQFLEWYGPDRTISRELSEIQFNTIRPDPQGGYWLTMAPSRAIYRYDGRNRTWTAMRESPDPGDRTSRHFGSGTSGDRDGGTWICVPGGLERYDPDRDRWTFHRFPAPFQQMPTNRVLADRDGTVWAGTGGLGLFRLDPRSGRWRRYFRQEGPHSLCDDRIQILYQDSRGDVWVGTEHGLSRIRVSGGRIDNHFSASGDPRTLSNDRVFGICEDRDGVVWVATGEGLDRFEPAENGWRRYSARDGLPRLPLFFATADLLGNLWLKSSNRLIRFTPATGRSRSFGEDDGLPPGGKTTALDGRGRVLLACMEGFAVIDPGHVAPEPPPPPVAISAFAVGRTLRRLGARTAMAPRFRLTPDQNAFSFEFAVLDYTRPELNLCAYRLEGFDRDWIEAGNHNYAAYGRVPPGDYTFRVVGRSSDGVWNRQGAALALTVARPFWMTWWFRSLLLALFAWLAHLFFLLVRRHVRILAFWKKRHQIGPYRITRTLGTGGMATVYLAESRLNRGTPVALKLMREEYALDVVRQKRFRQEGAIVDQLDHPHIVRILERGTHEGRLYIAMEYLPGNTLAERMRSEPPLTPAESLAILRQLADVLVKIHAHGIIHRDLKPANVILVPTGDGVPSVKVLDFGVARTQFQTTVTASGGLLGTIQYMAPEQFSHSLSTPAGDVYALGLIGYEMLALRHPFSGPEPLDTIRLILAADPPPLAEIRPGLPPAACDLIMRAIRRDPAQRPDAAALLAELRQLTETENPEHTD